MYKLNLSFQYYFPKILVMWDILDPYKENYATFLELKEVEKKR